MASTNQSFVTSSAKKLNVPVIAFLPDADEIEQTPLPRAAQATLYLLLSLLAAFVVWATFSEVDQVVVARGRLVTPLPNLVVQPLETSIIQSIEVRIGQVVKKGERLATLDPTFAGADEAQLRTRLRSLNAQIARLEAELADDQNFGQRTTDQGVITDLDQLLQAQLLAQRRASYRARLTQMRENIARLQVTVQTHRQDQQSLIARLKPLQEIEAMQESMLAKQMGARAMLLDARQKRMEVERDLQLAIHREQEAKRELAAAEAEKEAFERSWRQKIMEELLDTVRQRNEINEQLQKAEKRHQLVTLLAPADAVVLEMAKLSPGSVITAAERFFTLVPLAAELEAEVQIDSQDVGYVKIGDAVHLKLDAYPFQRHGTLSGKVRTISEDAFRRDNVSGTGLDVYYLSRIDLEGAHLKNMKGQERLLPGMTASAEIVVGKRSVISYLLWPLTKALDEAIREP